MTLHERKFFYLVLAAFSFGLAIGVCFPSDPDLYRPRTLQGTVVSRSTRGSNWYIFVKDNDGEVHKVRVNQSIHEAILIGGEWGYLRGDGK